MQMCMTKKAAWWNLRLLAVKICLLECAQLKTATSITGQLKSNLVEAVLIEAALPLESRIKSLSLSYTFASRRDAVKKVV